jgi:hypothetical protein
MKDLRSEETIPETRSELRSEETRAENRRNQQNQSGTPHDGRAIRKVPPLTG